jgi:hypothetical protein
MHEQEKVWNTKMKVVYESIRREVEWYVYAESLSCQMIVDLQIIYPPGNTNQPTTTNLWSGTMIHRQARTNDDHVWKV